MVVSQKRAGRETHYFAAERELRTYADERNSRSGAAMLALMTSESDRALLEQVVDAVVGRAAQVEWVEPGDGWSAHARLQGASGRISHVLTSPELQEARFEEPPCSVVIVTTTDEDEVLEALAKLARAALEYSRGGGHVERRRGLFGTRPVLVLRTEEGEWRIGKRSGSIPY